MCTLKIQAFDAAPVPPNFNAYTQRVLSQHTCTQIALGHFILTILQAMVSLSISIRATAATQARDLKIYN